MDEWPKCDKSEKAKKRNRFSSSDGKIMKRQKNTVPHPVAHRPARLLRPTVIPAVLSCARMTHPHSHVLHVYRVLADSCSTCAIAPIGERGGAGWENGCRTPAPPPLAERDGRGVPSLAGVGLRHRPAELFSPGFLTPPSTPPSVAPPPHEGRPNSWTRLENTLYIALGRPRPAGPSGRSLRGGGAK